MLQIGKKNCISKPCRFVHFCVFIGATVADGLLDATVFNILDCVSFFFGCGWELVTLSDDSESVLLSVLPEDADPPELLELAELSDFCDCAAFATNVTNNVMLK